MDINGDTVDWQSAVFGFISLLLSLLLALVRREINGMAKRLDNHSDRLRELEQSNAQIGQYIRDSAKHQDMLRSDNKELSHKLDKLLERVNHARSGGA